MEAHPPFTARVIRGAGRGKDLGTPTLNVEIAEVPSDIQEGIYAAFVIDGAEKIPAAVHYGPRPVFADDATFEVHLLDRTLTHSPESVTMQLIAYLREVRNFASIEDLKTQIAADIAQARAILDA